MIERPDPDALLAGPLGEWLAGQQSLRDETRATVARRRRWGIIGAVVLGALALVLGVEEVAITTEDEYFPTPRNLRDLLAGIDVLATLSLGGSVPDRPAADERSIHAADVLASL